MEWMRLVGFCLVAAVLVMILRQMHPSAAGLLCVAFGVMMVSALLPQVRAYVESIQTFFTSMELDMQYGRIMLKAMGIVLVTQMAVQICLDMDAPSVARRAELCGRMAMLGIVLPVFMELTQMAVDVLQ